MKRGKKLKGRDKRKWRGKELSKIRQLRKLVPHLEVAKQGKKLPRLRNKKKKRK